MPDGQDAVNRSLDWPAGIDTAGFLRDYWQQRALLVRQALPFAGNPLDPHELAGLATEADVASRLILFAEGDYRLEYGPFDAARLAALGPRDWSLLVTDAEKHLPELCQWLRPFQFLPRWRFDDLMISYAPDGASVGAHVDEYDVFLLQASGRRRWSIDCRHNAAHRLRAGSPLRLLDGFEASDSWILEPGDMLYLPPGVAHHGVAVGDDCMTWSIGYRAPLNSDILAEFTALLLEELAPIRYRDPPLKPVSTARYGEIDSAALAAVDALWQHSTSVPSERLRRLAGRLLTRPMGAPVTPVEGTHTDCPLPQRLSVNPFSRVAFIGEAGGVRLFADGEDYRCSAFLAQRLCEPGSTLSVSSLDDADDRELVGRLYEEGVLDSALDR